MSLGIKDFDFIKLLGMGAFGAVWLVKKKTTKDTYAMKIIDCSNEVINQNFIFKYNILLK